MGTHGPKSTDTVVSEGSVAVGRTGLGDETRVVEVEDTFRVEVPVGPLGRLGVLV